MTEKQSVSSNKSFFFAGIFSFVAAIGIHIYLALHHYRLKFGHTEGESACNINSTLNCDAVSASSYSEFFGVPIAVWGALTNLAALALLASYPLAEDPARSRLKKSIFILTGSIVSASVVMGFISAFAMSTYCIFCIAAYAASFVSFASVRKTFGPIKGAFAKSGTSSIQEYQGLAITGLVIVIGGFFINVSATRSFGFKDFNKMISYQISEWKANPQINLDPVQPLTLGADADSAKMTIVEFADFRCSHCKNAASSLHAFTLSHPDVRFLFQVYPLDGDCNRDISQSNGASCRLAMAVHCADKGGKGWEAHDWVFKNQHKFPTLTAVEQQLPKMAQEIQLDWQELNTCIQSSEARKAIEQQADLGSSVNIQGTPTIFVNGRKLPGGQNLSILKEAYRSL